MRVLVPAVFLLLASASGLSAQQPAAPLPAAAPPEAAQRPAPVFRSGANLVAINVTVNDGKRFIPGLQAGDFAVYEDGVQQRVDFFESSNVPVDLILLVDGSSSMRDKMHAVHEAALGFLKNLRPGDRGAVVAFADNVQVKQPLTGDHAALEAAVKGIEANGATALNNAVYIALKEFGRRAKQPGEVRRQAIALLSDGDDTVSLMSFDDVVELARKSSVNIYTIALKSTPVADSSRPYLSDSDYTMTTLAKETGADAFFPATVYDLKKIYATIAEELSTQYSLGYTPTNGRQDGRYRRIVVRMTNRPNLQPRSRTGYTADVVAAAAVRQPR